MRQRLVSLTAASGVLENLELALRVAGCTLTFPMLIAAASAGQLDACKWLRGRGCPWGYFHYLSAAARGGHRDVCEWLLAAGCPWTDEAVYAAARGGHVGLLDWLLLRRPVLGCRLSVRNFLAAAAEGCHLEALRHLAAEWLPCQADRVWQPRSTPLEGDSLRDVLAAAARSPLPDWREKVEWVEERAGLSSPVEWPHSPAVVHAASLAPTHDGLERVTWLRERGYALKWTADWARSVEGAVVAGSSAGRGPQVAIGRELLARVTALGGLAVPGLAEMWVKVAARCGDVALLQRLHGNGILAAAAAGGRQWLERAAAIAAAVGGQVRVLAWLEEELGFSFGAAAPPTPRPGGGGGGGAGRGGAVWAPIGDAAEAGQAEVVAWLLGRGAEATVHDWERAVRGGCQEILEMMLQGRRRRGGVAGGLPREVAVSELYRSAVSRADVATLRWLRWRVPYDLDERLLQTALWLGDPLPVLCWLDSEAGCRRWPWRAAVTKAEEAGALRPRELSERMWTWVEAQEAAAAAEEDFKRRPEERSGEETWLGAVLVSLRRLGAS